jgi:hypothetical protein
MARTKRKLRYGKKRSFKLPVKTDEVLLQIAEDKGITTSDLLRKIVDRWVWGYSHGRKPGRKPKAENVEMDVWGHGHVYPKKRTSTPADH